MDPQTIILNNSTVPKLEGVYVLGSLASRVTFHSQQCRAFNLIWALFESKKIDANKSVAVIGGGLAGMTAAAAAKSKGCNVTLYEKTPDLMNLQQGCYTRYIHPNIYDWPKIGCELAQTNLPMMNWKAAAAENVADQIMKEWKIYGKGVVVKKRSEINSVIRIDNKIRLQGYRPVLLADFDIVIVAVGFGLEKTIPFQSSDSYWAVDSYHKPNVYNHRASYDYLVSGTGDGGLIDAQRLLLSNFDHNRFSDYILGLTGVDDLKQLLLEIEKEAQARIETNSTYNVSKYLMDSYEQLDIPDWFISQVEHSLRTDIRLTMCGRDETPMNIRASILNRFVVFVLCKCKVINYVPGEITKSIIENDKTKITLSIPNRTNFEDYYDKVIVRHGPEPVYQTILPLDAVMKKLPLTDPTSKPMWNPSFYALKPATVKPIMSDDKAIKHLRGAKICLFDRQFVDGVGIGGDEENPFYLVVIKHNAPLDYSPGITEYEGIPVKAIRSSTKLTYQWFFNSVMGEKADLLKPGSAIRVMVGKTIIDDLKGIGTLGCFVETRNGTTGILSTSHILTNMSLLIEKRTPVLHIDDLLREEWPVANISPGLFTQLEYESEFRYTPHNKVDAAYALLNTGVPFNPYLSNGSELMLPKETATPMLGDRVFKNGAGSGLTRGRVIGKNIEMVVNFFSAKYVFQSIYAIEGEKTYFSAPGDSGSLVLREDGVSLGLLFSGSGNISYICPIITVLETLDLQLWKFAGQA